MNIEKNVDIGKTLGSFFVFCLSMLILFCFNRTLFELLPYCVTHVCGVTHNFGILDIVWLLSNLSFIYFPFLFIYLNLNQKKN